MNITTEHLHALPFWNHLNNAEKDMLRNNAYIRSFDRSSYIPNSMAGEDIGLMMLDDAGRGQDPGVFAVAGRQGDHPVFSSRSEYLHILRPESVQPAFLSGVSYIRLPQ